MARQLGAIKYKGTLGEVRHFKIKGLPGYFAGLKGGPTREQIQNAPEFERTRENMNEFGGSAIVAKAIRSGFSEVVKQMSDSRFTGRLTQIMKKINFEDTANTRGQRSFMISAHSNYLDGLSFNRNLNFDSIFYAPFSLTNSTDRDTSLLEVVPFNTFNLMNAPAGATHFRLVNAINVVSDYVYNPISKVYEPVYPQLNELSAIEYSQYVPLGVTTPTISVTAQLSGSPTLPVDVTVLNAIGIEFYQEVSSNYYLFNSGNTMKIKRIF